MDRTGKIAVAIAFVILIGWMAYQNSITPPPQPAAASPSPSPTPAKAGATPGPSPVPGAVSPGTVTPAGPAATPEPVLPEKTEQLPSAMVDFTFTNHGGGIQYAQLTQHIVDDTSKKNVVLNDYGLTPIGDIVIGERAGEGTGVSYTETLDGTASITYQRTTQAGLQITKKFTLPTPGDVVNEYVATLDLTVTNVGAQPYKSDNYYIYLGSAAPIHTRDMSRYICMDWYTNGKAMERNVASFGASNIPVFGHPETLEFTTPADKIAWAGVYNQYFTTILTPAGVGGTGIWTNRFPVDIPSHESGIKWLNDHAGSNPTWYAINGALQMPGFSLDPTKSFTQQFKIYTGPRQYALLKHLGEDQVAILHMGYSGPISKGLLKLLIGLQKIVGSYAVAIILLTIGIKLLLWPLQNRSTKSMKKMQALTPKMNELREKYKDDPTRLNQETLKLYRTYGINPLAGCLPVVIQLPVFVGFYSMLGSAIELRNSKFLWVHDLSQPDTIGHIMGYSINILPLCMAATSVWMMSMTPKSGDSSQQRTMMFMPLLFLWICYNYASGLALYMMVSNLFSVVQFMVTKNTTAPTLEKVASPPKKRR